MRAGIVTITNGENYGNRLQNYAVQEALKSLGFQAETIWKTTNVFDIENPLYLRKLKLKRFFHYHLTKEESRRLNFHRFNKKYIRRSRWKIEENIPQGLGDAYDYFIAGSDQVWNPYLTYCTAANFLTFAEKEKRIAFCPSIAITDIPAEKRECFKKWIGDFALLSIREEEGKDIIKKLCGREAEILGDPTIYLEADQWRKIERKVKVPREGYLLCYFLGNCSEEDRENIINVAKDRDLEVFWLQSEEHYSIGPDEFLYLIDHAECVCTDSFHGTVFSILFQKPFQIFQRKDDFVDMSSRLHTLLKLFSLKNQSGDYPGKEMKFFSDFSQTEEILKRERRKIEMYLKQIGRIDTNG